MLEAMSKSAMIRKIDDICSITRKTPLKEVRIIWRTGQGDVIGCCADDMDKMMQILADLSLAYSIIAVDSMRYVSTGRKASIVQFFLRPDTEHATNIDAEVMDHIVKLEWICGT